MKSEVRSNLALFNWVARKKTALFVVSLISLIICIFLAMMIKGNDTTLDYKKFETLSGQYSVEDGVIEFSGEEGRLVYGNQDVNNYNIQFEVAYDFNQDEDKWIGYKFRASDISKPIWECEFCYFFIVRKDRLEIGRSIQENSVEILKEIPFKLEEGKFYDVGIRVENDSNGIPLLSIHFMDHIYGEYMDYKSFESLRTSCSVFSIDAFDNGTTWIKIQDSRDAGIFSWLAFFCAGICMALGLLLIYERLQKGQTEVEDELNSSLLTVSLFGGMCFYNHGECIKNPLGSSKKMRAMFIYLFLSEEACSKDELIDYAWRLDDNLPSDDAFHAMIYKLRKTFKTVNEEHEYITCNARLYELETGVFKAVHDILDDYYMKNPKGLSKDSIEMVLKCMDYVHGDFLKEGDDTDFIVLSGYYRRVLEDLWVMIYDYYVSNNDIDALRKVTPKLLSKKLINSEEIFDRVKSRTEDKEISDEIVLFIDKLYKSQL